MARRRTTGQLCERAREWASLRLDGELSELEGALLEAHLRRCAECRAFAADVTEMTAALRAAELEPLTAPVVLPRRTRVPVRAFQVSAAAALVLAAAGLGSLFGILNSGGGAPSPSDGSSVVAFQDTPNSLRQLRRQGLILQTKTIPRNLDLPSV